MKNKNFISFCQKDSSEEEKTLLGNCYEKLDIMADRQKWPMEFTHKNLRVSEGRNPLAHSTCPGLLKAAFLALSLRSLIGDTENIL